MRRSKSAYPISLKAKLINEPVDDATREFVGRLIIALGDRIKLFGDIVRYDEYFVADDALSYDEKAFAKRLRKDAAAGELLSGFRDRLTSAESFEPDALEALLKAFVAERDVKLGAIIHALRVAVTGKPAGPGMFECLALVGRERCVTRIDRALAQL